MFRFEELDIWKRSVDYAKDLYRIAYNFPQHEIFALGDQLRRAAVSISNNIAEGSGGTNNDFAKFIDIAIKSTLETVNCLYLAEQFDYINNAQRKEFYFRAEELIKMMRAFKNKIRPYR